MTIDSLGKRSYIAEPKRGRRRWRGDEETKLAVYANRRRVKGSRGRRLMRRRGEMLERPFAHLLETGGMRRVFLRGRENVEKRYQIHVAAYNLGLLMRTLFGKGTPRGLQGLSASLQAAAMLILRLVLRRAFNPRFAWCRIPRLLECLILTAALGSNRRFATGC